MTRRAGGRVLALALALVPAGGCTPAEPPALEPVTFASPVQLSSVVGHIAQDAGYFAEQGLDVRFLTWNSEGTALPSLAQGELDVTSTGPLAPRYFNLIARGGAIRFVAARSLYAVDGCPYSAFVARAELLDSGRLTDDPASIAGLRVSTERTSSNYYLVDRLLARGGLTAGDIVRVDMPKEVKEEAFRKGLLDVATATEPWPTRYARSGEARIWKSTSEILPDHQNTFLLFGKRLLEERRDLGVRFLAAYLKGARRYLDEGKSARNLEVVQRLTRLDRDELLEACWPPWSRDGRIDRRTLVEYQQWALAEGLIDEVVPFERLVDESFLDAVARGEAAAVGGAP